MEDISVEDIKEGVEEITTQAFQFRDYLMGKAPEIVDFCLRVVLALLVFWIGRKLIRWILKILESSMKKAGADKGVRQFTMSLSKIALYVLMVIGIAQTLGVQETSVAALLGTAGVTIGLALQGGLANIAGGIMILTFKPFQVGDYIILNQQNNCEGTVSKIDTCYTTLLSLDNKHIIIPNGTLSENTITNVTARDKRKLAVTVGISYDSDLRLAKEILERLLKEDPDAQTDKDMIVYVDELSDSAVKIGFQVWVDTSRYFPTKWRMNEKIKTAYDEAGIEIAYQQVDVHIHS
ncbi:MAG: mechanosensitive ion channel family protein [Blautia sp.]|nr:mechanosensitive ion channel family protein [Blautia sp.]